MKQHLSHRSIFHDLRSITYGMVGALWAVWTLVAWEGVADATLAFAVLTGLLVILAVMRLRKGLHRPILAVACAALVIHMVAGAHFSA